jgi:hypothetical protein
VFPRFKRLSSGVCEILADAQERMNVYCEEGPRRIIRAILAVGKPLGPEDLIEASRLEQEKLKPLLDQLVSSGVLQASKKVYRAAIKDTGETEFQARLLCPVCGSPDIIREELVEHVVCGFTGKAN